MSPDFSIPRDEGIVGGLAGPGRRNAMVSGSNWKVVAMLCLAAGWLAAWPVSRAAGQTSEPSSVARTIPFGPAEVILLRTTLVAIDQANRTDQYAVLRALMVPGLARSSTPEVLAGIFRPWREKQRDIAFSVIAEAELDTPPSIDADGVLQLSGGLATPGFPLQFDLSFRQLSERWALASFSLSDGVLTITSPKLAAEQIADAPRGAVVPRSPRLPPLPPVRPRF